ncbi:MAG: glycerophosphoryl diester phosphodiesterase membrane domain-containing protein [Solobacterium sp.]|nr:glycerophosphoryl diester phosphodiesterase membrane domain-containing protein [Solobacterium sp.]
MKNERDEKLRAYLENSPDIIKYQIVTKLILAVWLFFLGRLLRLLLNSTGRVAVTSGDFTFLFGTWQGILMILIVLVSLFVYVALDLGSKIVLSENLLTQRNLSIGETINQALRSVRHLMCLDGIGVSLYIALIAPLLGVGLSISLTEGLYIPTFISSVIASTPLYLVLSVIAVLIFLSIGVANLFILHGIFIDDLPAKEASQQSRTLIRANWKDYLKQNVLFILVMAAVLLVVAGVLLVLPLFLTDVLPLSAGVKRWLTIFFLLLGVVFSGTADLLATPFYIMKMTQLYDTYKNGTPYVYPKYETRPHPFAMAGVIVTLVTVLGLTIYLNNSFDSLFPLYPNVWIIAHRAGGAEGAENTVSGMETAWQIGAYGSEIDIQRTKDGYYILNHDGDFKRVAGDSRKPEEMTLEEIRQLSVDGKPIPTYEEMLEACRGKMVLFTELKGATADQQMADDAVRIIKEHGMEDEVVLISLKYELINYIETVYPEMQTGFLTFASFGDTAKLNCDYLGLEEESATSDAIREVHKQGKKILIWTANKRTSQRHFLCSEADGVITDNVLQAMDVIHEIQSRSDLSRIIDRLRELVG